MTVRTTEVVLCSKFHVYLFISACLPPSYIEFRLWKQGRVNIENLSQKLKGAVCQANWDIILEYYLLKEPLCVEYTHNKSNKLDPIYLVTADMNYSKEIEFNCMLDIDTDRNIRPKLFLEKSPKYEHHSIRKKKHRQVIPNTTKSSRLLVYDEFNKEKEHNEKLNSRPIPKLNTLESGESGMLSSIYSKDLPNWLEFGVSLGTPSVKSKRISLANRHMPNIIVGELLNILPDSPKAFRCLPTKCTKDENFDLFVPYVASPLTVKCIMISRNLEYWYTTINISENSEFPDIMSPQALKHRQKFIPTVSNNVFIPRQKILWLVIENDSVSI